MATNITFTDIVGATLRADNSYDENRAYGIDFVTNIRQIHHETDKL